MDTDSPSRTTRKPSSPPEGTPASRRLRSASQAEAARTANACRICRDKKVKCSGQRPCKYCAKRGLECVFAASEKRKLYSVSQIREMEEKLASYERRGREKTASVASPVWPVTVGEVGAQSVQEQTSIEDSCISVDISSPTVPVQPPSLVPRGVLSPVSERARGIETVPVSATPGARSRAIAPESALSSSETFGSEIKTLLISRSNPGSAGSPSANPNFTPLPHVDKGGLFEAIGPWPTEDEAHAMLDIVVFNVGISQQLFDVRAFSDNLSALYQDPGADVRVPEVWIVEALLVFAVGRLLLGKHDDDEQLPGTRFFGEAVKRTPVLGELRKHGVVGVEVMALTALYLQIVDRKDDAYLHSNTALRLAISHGMHRASRGKNIRRSESVHRNRLWWSIYMQERLCAAGGYPMSIEDYAITTEPPYEVLGFPSAAALGVNVEAARITGKITSTIYSQKGDPETAFINNVQSILHSLYEIEKTMPSEYFLEIKQAGLFVAGRPFVDSSTWTSRTSSSLYISIYSAMIHTVRPVLLYMARNSRNPEHEGSCSEVSPALVRLAEICVETASKSLAILQELRRREILAKNAFLDLDATFSVGYIFVLVQVISPENGLGFKGIDGARAILGYLVGLGNRAAASRLAELDQMCEHLALSVPGHTPRQASMDVLMQPFSFLGGYGSVQTANPNANHEARGDERIIGGQVGNAVDGDGDRETFGFGGVDLASLPLEGENSLYWVYHTPGFSFTGVEQTDWEALENQIPWGAQA